MKKTVISMSMLVTLMFGGAVLESIAQEQERKIRIKFKERFEDLGLRAKLEEMAKEKSKDKKGAKYLREDNPGFGVKVVRRKGRILVAKEVPAEEMDLEMRQYADTSVPRNAVFKTPFRTEGFPNLQLKRDIVYLDAKNLGVTDLGNLDGDI